MKLRHGFVLLALLVAPTVASANEFISTNTNDWFRYKEAGSGQTVQSQITYDLGGWRQWSEFGGLGTTWVYTSDNHDYFWLWNGSTYTLVGNLSGSVGDAQNVDMPCNRGRAWVATKGSLTTAAGTFNDTTELRFTTSCADAGTTAIWFAKGVGIVKWTQSTFAGGQTWELQSAFVNGRNISAAPATPAAPSTGSNRAVAPPEHAQMESILWGANDTYIVIPTYTDAFRGLNGSGVTSEVIVASQGVASQLRYEMAQANVSLNDVEILVANIDSVWMRDYGPIVLKRPNGERVVADPDYYPGRPNDNRIPSAYANYRGWSRVRVPVSFEGGNFATDGRTMTMCSLGVQWFNRDLSKSAIEREFKKFGTDRVEWFEPLVDEGTTHVDMFMRIMSDSEALVSSYPSSHRQTRVVDAAAAKLRGLGYSVTRVPAHQTYDEYATYSNSVLANGIALVPQYGSATKDREALRAYERLGFRAVGVDSRLIIRYSGATHCVSMQVPAGR